MNTGSLKNSTEFLNLLLENITSAIFIVDSDTRIRAFNDSFRVLFFRQEDKIIGELCGNALGCIFVEDGSPCGSTAGCKECILRKSLESSLMKDIPSNRKKLVRDFLIGGRRIRKYFQYSTRIIRYQDEKMVLVILDDITLQEEQKQQIEKQLIELQELEYNKERHIESAIHDLKNPLSVIYSFSEILQNNSMNESDRVEMLKELKNVAVRAFEVIDSKLAKGITEREESDLVITKQADLIQLIEDSISLMMPTAEASGIKLKAELPGFPVPLDFDIFKINRVLNDFLLNALRHSPAGTEVLLSVKLLNDQIRISVKNEGTNVDQAEVERIFHLENGGVLKRSRLDIARQAVEEHGGRAGVDSSGEKGALFWFSLPLESKRLLF